VSNKGVYSKVPTARRLVASLMTSCDRHHTHDVTIFSRIRKLGTGSTILMDLLSTHYRTTLYYKISSFGLELWEKKLIK